MKKDKVQYIEVEILTPTHVGVAKESHWMPNADYYYENGKVYKYNLLQYLKEKNDLNAIGSISTALTTGKTIDNRYLKELKAQAEHVFPLSAKPNEANGIRPQIRTGVGFPILPGSSLKGAVRSVMYKHLFQKHSKLSQRDLLEIITAERQGSKPTVKILFDKKKLDNWSEEKLIGIYGSSLLRLFKFTDIEFLRQDTNLYVNKIRTINGGVNGQAGWKADNFNNVYECLKPATKAIGRMVIERELYELIRQFDRSYHLPGATEFLVQNQYEHLFGIINTHTRNYIKKEKKFLDRWEHTHNDLIDFEMIEEALAKCQDNKSCILRVASGSGFHSITGDWQNPDDHYTRTTTGKDVFNKTRRFAVDGQQLLPMGFIKLTLLDETIGRQRLHNHAKEVEAYLNNQRTSVSHTTESASETLPPSPPKPAEPEKFNKKIGKNTEGIPAKVIIGTKGKIQVQLWTDQPGYEGKLYKVSYGSDLPEGSFIIVKHPDDKNKTANLQKLY
jgi:CRISPR-associated protein Csm5